MARRTWISSPLSSPPFSVAFLGAFFGSKARVSSCDPRPSCDLAGLRRRGGLRGGGFGSVVLPRGSGSGGWELSRPAGRRRGGDGFDIPGVVAGAQGIPVPVLRRALGRPRRHRLQGLPRALRAGLPLQAVNVCLGPNEERQLLTGLHTVNDIYCSCCRQILGWRYEKAYEESQKYKEGKCILEKARMLKER